MSESNLPLSLGTFLGKERFRPLAVIGRGGAGIVYRVYDEETGAEVALKTLPARDPSELYYLKQEFRVLAGIAAPNLVELYELVVNEAECFFTMEFIDGCNFVDHVRGDGRDGDSFEPAAIARCIAATAQVVHGLAFLHAAGRLHRDIKPSNVLVGKTGRVVILDFGLASVLGPESSDSETGTLVGTLDYMSPEQAWGREPSPAADWYSVGVMLYEALAGVLPFDGTPDDVLTRKQSGKPRPVRALQPLVPQWLDDLVLSLLDPEASRRPNATALLSTIAANPIRGLTESIPPAPMLERAPFVGRGSELVTLQRAFGDTRDGRLAIVEVSGPSGIGKSRLMRRFLGTLDQDPGVWVLRGRCHPEETVPYKAFDDLIDGLSRKLLQVGDATAAAVRPRHAWALTRLFPVLGRVPSLAATEEAEPDAEPYEVRRRGFGALREMLARIGNEAPLILWIDDLQWGDADSAALLREVLRPPEAPVLLLLVTYRSEDRAAVTALGALAGAEEAGTAIMRRVEVGPLSSGETRELAQLLCAESSAGYIDSVAQESEGSPFFVSVLARHISGKGPAAEQTPGFRLATAVNDRVQSLKPTARQILEIVSVAGRPLERRLVLAAAGALPRERPLLLNLEQNNLVRSTTLAENTAIEVYHDRIRETIIAELLPESLRDRHRSLAEVLVSQPAPDPEALFRHFLGAEEKERAADWAVHAGDRSANALAFADAARFYGQALELKIWNASTAATLRVKRADTLVNAGRGAEAAPLFLQVAGEAPLDQALECRRRAAEQYLVSGRTDEGVEILRPLLQELGLRYPRSPAAAMRGTLLRLLQLRMRGSHFAHRTAAETPPAMLRRVDLCYSAARGLVSVDTMRGGYLALVGLLLALNAGEAVRVGRSLVFAIGAVLVPAGGVLTRWGLRLLDIASEIAAETRDPYLLGGMAVTRGQAGVFLGDWQQALQQNDEGLDRLRESCRGVNWECNFARSGALRALEELGRLREFSQRAQEMATVAAELGDRYAEMTAALYIGIARIVGGDVPGARHQLHAAMAGWSQGGFHLQHLYALRIEAYGDIYEGDAERAWQRVQDCWPEIERSFFLRVSVTRIDAHLLRARVALASAAAVPTVQKERLKVCSRDAERLSRENRPDTTAHAAMLRGGIAMLGGDRKEAVRCVQAAIDHYTPAGMAAYCAGAERRKGELVGGCEGERLVASAEQSLREAGVADPQRWVAIHFPGFTAAA